MPCTRCTHTSRRATRSSSAGRIGQGGGGAGAGTHPIVWERSGKVKYAEAAKQILRTERDEKRKHNKIKNDKGEHNVRGKSTSSWETNWQDWKPGASCEATAGKDNDWTDGKSWADSKSRNDSEWTDSRTSADSKAWTESAWTDSRASADSTAWTDSWNWNFDGQKWKHGSWKAGGWPPSANKSCDVMRKW